MQTAISFVFKTFRFVFNAFEWHHPRCYQGGSQSPALGAIVAFHFRVVMYQMVFISNSKRLVAILLNTDDKIDWMKRAIL
jgi:hypothetical protein